MADDVILKTYDCVVWNARPNARLGLIEVLVVALDLRQETS
jgi:hypothetical protein